ncbi:ABC transporter substrate-binding protein [Candidatus Stoquefichus massiliensis]|uniref:ABC transporter substrate-binding protein n=1 Tax=Candidatus Stoquefichus massiliensis TaxID=1470350 RepID=UPI0004846DE0|nr:ABC transporter substrate-binding protein [Candidatus Stoquefichus massiliensis]
MGHKRKILSLFVVVTMMFSLIACTPKTSTQSTQIELTDQAKRLVTLKQPAQKIVSCYYITTYATLSLGISDRLVGIEKKAESRPIYQMANQKLLNLKQVGSLKELNIEAIAELKPDLVLMPLKLKEKAQILTDLGIPVLVVNPETHEQLVEMLSLIGKACGVEDKAKQLSEYYQTQIDKMSKVKTNSFKTIYMGANSSYLETAPASMYQSTLIEMAGGMNVAKDLKGDYWTKVSYETLLKMNPDMFIIPTGASYTIQDIFNDPQLKTLKAVQTQSVYQMPQGIEEWDSPIPSGILGTMWLHSLLYPENYSFDTFEKDVKDFYQTFYGFDIDQSLMTK